MLQDDVRSGVVGFGRVCRLRWEGPRGIALSFVLGRRGGVGVAVEFVFV